MKKIFVILLTMMLVASSLYAAEDAVQTVGVTLDSRVIKIRPYMIGDKNTTVSVVNNPFSGIWGFYLQVVRGAIGGGLMLIRFATELVAAVIYEGEDSTAKVRKVIIRFLVHVGVAVMGFSTLSLLLL